MLRPPYAASRTAPVRAVVLTNAERFENFRNRAIHASPISFSMPARSSDDTIVAATVTLRNSAPSASQSPRLISSPATALLRVSRSAICALSWPCSSARSPALRLWNANIIGMALVLPGVRPLRVRQTPAWAAPTILTISAIWLIVNSVNIVYSLRHGALHRDDLPRQKARAAHGRASPANSRLQVRAANRL